MTFFSTLFSNAVTDTKRIFSWRRLRVMLMTSFILTLLFSLTWQTSHFILIGRLLLTGTVLLLTFGLFETWPRRLPRWVARWALQVAAVAFVVPFVTAFGYSITTLDLPTPWWRDPTRLEGFAVFTFLGMLLSPWMAVTALLNQIKEAAHKQALTFELERSEFERQAVNARLRLLQAQVEPHFLFNTLANVRELVVTGSPRASTVLDSLIAYLRAAVPRLNNPLATMGQELELVRAYLEVMYMRMPDRLQFTLCADEDAKQVTCPPMTLLTLVENAMRHGIDPAEDGGRIDVRVSVAGGRCVGEVIDTGLGLASGSESLGTGLANLRERLQLAFNGDATVDLTSIKPHGTVATINFPAAVTV
jgi:signal transduction histidine kinase